MIKRPKKVQKGERNYLSNERYQDYSEQQFNNIYDYLDKLVKEKLEGTVLYENSSGTTESFELDADSTKYKNVEIYVMRDTGDIKGRIIRADLVDGQVISLDFIDNDGGTITRLYHARIAFHGKNVNVSGNNETLVITKNGSIYPTENKLAIYKIVGFQ